MAQDSAVLRAVTLALVALVLAEGKVEDPVQQVLNAPMRAHQMSEPFGVGGKTGDVVGVTPAGLLIDGALRLFHADTGEAFEPLSALNPAQLFGRPALTNLDPATVFIYRLVLVADAGDLTVGIDPIEEQLDPFTMETLLAL